MGKDGKVLFIKYANFIRRVPLDRIIPADVQHEPEEEEPSPDDVDNFDRLQDDEFENVEIVAQKDLQIKQLMKTYQEQTEIIKELENNISHKKSTIAEDEVKEKKNILPKMWQRITFKVAGNSLNGKEYCWNKNGG